MSAKGHIPGAGVAPHPPLPVYYRRPEERPGYVRSLFDRSADNYDRINALLSFGTGRAYRRNMLRDIGVRPGMRILDVAIGTGQVALEARRLLGGTGLVVGLDASEGMLAQARRADAADVLVLGRAEALPFATGSFDLISIGYALRHVSDINLTFREFRRVLRPGGSLLVLELSRPEAKLGQMLMQLVFGHVLPWISRLTTGSGNAQTLMRYYWETINKCVPPNIILREMRAANLGGVRSEVQFGILRTYTGLRT